jgi:hypothetical protein
MGAMLKVCPQTAEGHQHAELSRRTATCQLLHLQLHVVPVITNPRETSLLTVPACATSVHRSGARSIALDHYEGSIAHRSGTTVTIL